MDSQDDFLNKLELSVRASNVCRAQGWTTYDRFMAVKEADWIEVKGAGRRTWLEVRDMQRELRRIATGDDQLAKAVQLIREARIILQHLDPTGQRLRVVLEDDGQPVIYRRLA